LEIASLSHSYKSREQVSGYFDGDGTPILRLMMFTICPCIDWADTYGPQVEAVRTFLVERGIRSTNSYPRGHSKPVWHLRLYESGGLLIAAQAMLSNLMKKRDQVHAIIVYLQDRITGEELVGAFNRATISGTRSGFLREVKMPYTHSQGVAHARDLVHSGKRVSSTLTKEILAEIVERQSRGETLRDISLAYGVSKSAIMRARLRVARLEAKSPDSL